MTRIVRTSSAPGSRRVAAGQKHKRRHAVESQVTLSVRARPVSAPYARSVSRLDFPVVTKKPVPEGNLTS